MSHAGMYFKTPTAKKRRPINRRVLKVLIGGSASRQTRTINGLRKASDFCTLTFTGRCDSLCGTMRNLLDDYAKR